VLDGGATALLDVEVEHPQDAPAGVGLDGLALPGLDLGPGLAADPGERGGVDLGQAELLTSAPHPDGEQLEFDGSRPRRFSGHIRKIVSEPH